MNVFRFLLPSTSQVRAPRAAFTIIELLAVVSIISILMGMIGAASYAARQKAYRAQANTEVREIANACRAYWIAFGTWPGGMSGTTETIKKGGAIYNALTGNNPTKVVFLQLDEERFEGDGGDYLDPWGNAYEVTFNKTEESTLTHHFSTAVTLPMRNRHEYYGKQFQKN